jgi:hypothetical protein
MRLWLMVVVVVIAFDESQKRCVSRACDRRERGHDTVSYRVLLLDDSPQGSGGVSRAISEFETAM